MIIRVNGKEFTKDDVPAEVWEELCRRVLVAGSRFAPLMMSGNDDVSAGGPNCNESL